MGDIADGMLSGVLCQVCGEYLGGEGDGFPVTCGGCRDQDERDATETRMLNDVFGMIDSPHQSYERGKMPDPRISYGVRVEPNVKGPYGAQPARRDATGDDGGTLDVGITAHTNNGTLVVIGEIWAACPNENGGKTRIDAIAVATRLVAKLNEETKNG